MIKPTDADIGRTVIYTPRARDDGSQRLSERGVLMSFSKDANIVFVRYGDDLHTKATYRVDLDWEHEITEGE